MERRLDEVIRTQSQIGRFRRALGRFDAEEVEQAVRAAFGDDWRHVMSFLVVQVEVNRSHSVIIRRLYLGVGFVLGFGSSSLGWVLWGSQ